MIKQHFDLLNTVQEQLASFRHIMRMKPHALLVSRASFTWLIRVFQDEMKVYGVCPVDFERWTYTDGSDTVRIMIDEMADDYTVKVI